MRNDEGKAQIEIPAALKHKKSAKTPCPGATLIYELGNKSPKTDLHGSQS